MDPLQVDDVLEVPAHQDISAANCGHGNMLGVGPHIGCENSGGYVAFGELAGLGIKLKRFDVHLRHSGESPTNLDWGLAQLVQREAGENQDKLASDKALHEPNGVLGKLLVLAATQDRCVRVDPGLQRSILSELCRHQAPPWTGWPAGLEFKDLSL